MKNSIRLFVLAGGKGQRLFPFSSVIPKCLIPVAGKPCARWIVEDAIQQGFNDIVLCVNKTSEPNFRHEFRDLNFKYSISQEPQGTVAELLCAKRFIDNTFILRYGDDLTEVNYNELLSFHRNKMAVATLAVTTEFMLPVGIVETSESGRIKKFVEKPKLGKLSWVGIAVLEPKVMEYFQLGEDIAADTLPRMLKSGEPIYSFETHSHWYDVGNLEHWRRAEEHFRKSNMQES